MLTWQAIQVCSTWPTKVAAIQNWWLGCLLMWGGVALEKQLKVVAKCIESVSDCPFQQLYVPHLLCNSLWQQTTMVCILPGPVMRMSVVSWVMVTYWLQTVTAVIPQQLHQRTRWSKGQWHLYN